MSKSSLTRDDYVTELTKIINEPNLSVEEISRRLVSLVPAENRKEKCPEVPPTYLKDGIDVYIDSFWEFVKVEDKELWRAHQMQQSGVVDINARNLAEVISRTYKRKEYYRYFHNITKVSELKETALICFWLIKLKPFTVLDDKSVLRHSVNEKFSLNLILSQIKYLLDSKGMDFKMPDQCFIQDTLYSFKYRDLSKEAMILFVDSVASAYGITIDSWI